MIFRRVTGHFRKQEKTAIFLDFCIVVAGAFVATRATSRTRQIRNKARGRRRGLCFLRPCTQAGTLNRP